MRKDYEDLAAKAREALRKGEIDTDVCEVISHNGAERAKLEASRPD